MADPLSRTQPRVVRVSEIPTEEKIDFQDTSFFTRNAPEAKLPSPEEVRKLNFEVNGRYAKNQRPPLVFYEDLGLVVKYGRWIHVAEAQCLWWFNRHMKDVVPTPELFGWRHDEDEVFIYMELIKGEILEDAWPDLSEEEKEGICQELRACVKAWRGLKQETEPYFIGHIGHQGVADIIFRDEGDFNAGPFPTITAFHDFFARYTCRQKPEDFNPRQSFPELAGLRDDRPVVFTHADLCMKNVMVTPAKVVPELAKERQDGASEEMEGERGHNAGAVEPPRRLAAVIDWTQSGWYPADWEWLKSYWMCMPIVGGGRDTAWLDRIMDPPDEQYMAAWEWVTDHCSL